MLTAGGG